MSQSNQWTYLLNMFSYLPKARNGTFAGLRNGRTVLIPWIVIVVGLSRTYASCCSGVGHCIVGPDQAVAAAPLLLPAIGRFLSLLEARSLRCPAGNEIGKQLASLRI